MAKIVTARLVLATFVASVVLIALAAHPAHACDTNIDIQGLQPGENQHGNLLVQGYPGYPGRHLRLSGGNPVP